MVEGSRGSGDSPIENMNSLYVSMIKDANRILDTLSRVWKYSLAVLLASVAAIGLVSITLFLLDTSKEQFFTEGIIYLAIAAWGFARNIIGTRRRHHLEDIPHWKDVLASFTRHDNVFDSQIDGQSVIESLMKVVIATGDWIKTIRRDVFSALFWPIVATVIFLLSVYQVNVLELRILEIAFITYIFALTLVVYYVINLKFRNWQIKVAQFKRYTTSALENL